MTLNGKRFLCVMVFVTLEMVLFLPCGANPLPSTTDFDSEANPLPENWEEYTTSNMSIFLKAETINVTFTEDKASMRALYILKNEASNETSLDILLPFVERPSNVELMVSGEPWNYSWIETRIFVPNRIDSTWTHDILSDESIHFSLTFDGYEEKEVVVLYTRKYLIAETRYDNKVVYEFRYIIGTARWWKYPLETACFEFWIQKEAFDKRVIYTSTHFSHLNLPSYFTNSTKKGFIGLSVEYHNWIPVKDDYLVVYWEKAKPFFSTPFGKFLVFGGLFLGCSFVFLGFSVLPTSDEKITRIQFLLLPIEVVLFLLLFLLFLISSAALDTSAAIISMISFLLVLFLGFYFLPKSFGNIG
ncbi:MAG: hypothetical protein ACXADY_22055 [Candidatus Hodarchaeales archaeon]|jgi:hypothetical protein